MTGLDWTGHVAALSARLHAQLKNQEDESSILDNFRFQQHSMTHVIAVDKPNRSAVLI